MVLFGFYTIRLALGDSSAGDALARFGVVLLTFAAFRFAFTNGFTLLEIAARTRPPRPRPDPAEGACRRDLRNSPHTISLSEGLSEAASTMTPCDLLTRANSCTTLNLCTHVLASKSYRRRASFAMIGQHC